MCCEQKSVKILLSQLEYEVNYIEWESDLFKYNFKNNTHYITHPAKDSVGLWYLYFLHEHIHAFHREKLSSPFSENPSTNHLPFGYDQEVYNYFNTVRDWFVVGSMIEYCIEETKFLIRYEYDDIVKKINPNMDVKDRLIAGLVSAQVQFFLKEPGKYKMDDLHIQKVAETLLGFHPNDISVENLYSIVSKLFKIFGYFEIYTDFDGAFQIKQLKEMQSMSPPPTDYKKIMKELM